MSQVSTHDYLYKKRGVGALGALHHNSETAGRFDMLVLDTFTSDAIPTHLVTQEALALYRTRLTPEGVLVFNISNRYLCLERVPEPTQPDCGNFRNVSLARHPLV